MRTVLFAVLLFVGCNAAGDEVVDAWHGMSLEEKTVLLLSGAAVYQSAVTSVDPLYQAT